LSGRNQFLATGFRNAVLLGLIVITCGRWHSAAAQTRTATAAMSLTAGSTYSGTMNLSCKLSSSPANAQSPPTCDLNPATVTIAAGGNATTTLTVKTTGGTSANAVPLKNRLWGFGNGALTLAAMLMIGMGFRRRRWIWMFALLVIGISVTVGGCWRRVKASGDSFNNRGHVRILSDGD
jgi:hypothetical protein